MLGARKTGLGAARVLGSPHLHISNYVQRYSQNKNNSLVCRLSLFASRFGYSIHHQAKLHHTLIAMSIVNIFSVGNVYYQQYLALKLFSSMNIYPHQHSNEPKSVIICASNSKYHYTTSGEGPNSHFFTI